MANNLNNITVVGNVTRDPEMRYTPTGISQITLGVAVNRSWKNQQTNEWEERTSFFDVVCWRELADNVGASVKKGTRIVVTGRLEQRSWDNQQGEKQYRTEIIAEEVGPSLRFATADVHRTERRGPADGGGYGNDAPSGGGAPAPAGAPGGYDDMGEEPF
jgi:single-strand DNA-binding protein